MPRTPAPPPDLKPLVIKASDTIRQKVHKHLRDRIVSGAIAPGARLVETSIAKEIGASRTPVREALHALEREGLIESRPRIGYVTKAFSREELEEICEIRCAIEALAAGRALQKARNKVIAELSRNIGAAEERIAAGRIKDFIEIDSRFHQIIAKCSGSSRLLELAEMLRSHMVRYRTQSIYAHDNVRDAIEGHKRILAAIESGDVEQVQNSIRQHLLESKEAIIRYANLQGQA
jgi:DNA-binding GntR family transcriptional regulator